MSKNIIQPAPGDYSHDGGNEPLIASIPPAGGMRTFYLQRESPASPALPVKKKAKKKGRLPKVESDALRTALLATLRQHPTLISDIPQLAKMIGVSESTARRWKNAEQDKYNQQLAQCGGRDDED